MLSSDELLEQWNGLSHHSSGYVRIDGIHPLDWYLGHEEINQKSLLLVCHDKPGKTPSSKSILTSTGRRGDGNWALVFRLIRDEHEDVFIRFACDLIESSREQLNNRAGINFVINRYKQWAKLMEQQSSVLLGESERKGLLGELIFLQKCLYEGITCLEAVSSWMGPEGADQDFIFSSRWYEIKTVGIGSKTFSISSLEQLNAPPPGELVLYYIDKTAPRSAGAFTLLGKVSEIKETLKDDPTAKELFITKLLQYGFIDLKDYEEFWYRQEGSNTFEVDYRFPKLTRGNVPVQVTAASYDISIHAIANWKTQ